MTESMASQSETGVQSIDKKCGILAHSHPVLQFGKDI